jgi:hypothetical protein
MQALLAAVLSVFAAPQKSLEPQIKVAAIQF